MRATASRAWIALTLAGLLATGCATRTQAPVADRDAVSSRSSTQGLGRPGTSGQPSTYVVKRGDTLYSIATSNGLEPRELAAMNKIDDPGSLRVGQVLVLARPQTASRAADDSASGSVSVNPVTTTAPVEARPLGAAGAPLPGAASASGASPSAAGASSLKTGPKAAKLPYSEQNLALLRRGADVRSAQPEPAAPDKPAATVPGAGSASRDGGPNWAWPAAGKIVSTFKQSGGKGVAIAGNLGDPVYASAAGTVVYSGEGLPSYGKLIIVKHSDEFLSVYAHNSAILVKEKQTVAKGQKIAEMGTSGAGAPSPRLHFEIRRLGKTVDPEELLPGRP